jgi:CDGSH-type Zn-finger protein/mannose-6-phosphate isomerase-like protein (cupin superfamily)
MTQAPPVVATRKPFYRELRAGQRVLWCSCGRSARQPFCDGKSHVGTGYEPLEYQAAQAEEVLFCGCKQTGTPPFCDGAHSNLPGGYKNHAADTSADVPRIQPDAAGVASLDGTCYVVTPKPPVGAGYQIATLVSPAMGAQHQSQFHIMMAEGTSPVLTVPTADVVLWVRQGQGAILIGDRRFAIEGACGISILRGETFRIEDVTAPLSIYVSVCPAADALEERDSLDPRFDDSFPERVIGIDEKARHAMGPRYFQMLVDERHGLTNTAQFIGHIPTSRAEMHRHLYEEALVIMAGYGTIWNETVAADVAPGDVIFFPRKHVHSLECRAPEGMDVVGLIHPGTNPGINY